MKSLKTGYLCPAAIALAASTIGAHASTTDELAKMVTEGTAALSFRYRFETVEQDHAPNLAGDGYRKDAEASTLRSRLTLKTATFKGFSALVEANDVTTVGTDDYDSLMINNKHYGLYSVVPDPKGTEVNQAWVKYSFSEQANSIVGRQTIIQADQRFVGNVGWRQNEQTFDAFRFTYTGDRFTLDYGYLWRVNRIFEGSGTSSQPTKFNGHTHILLATTPVGSGKLGAYVYALDFEESAPLSSLTYGLSYDATFEPVTLSASVANQTDYGDNSNSFDALFLSLEGKVSFKPATLIAGYSLLGSDDGTAAFTTPLATLHKFQGWADIFLATPVNGVEDLYLGATGNLGPFNLGAFYHDFSADKGGADYGSEVDLSATYPVNKYLSLQLKYADYNADDYQVDTQKLWFSVMVDF